MDKTAEIIRANCKELLVKRMFFALATSIIVHFILMSGVILVTNLKITHPLEWIQNTWNVITCLRMWTYFLIFSMVIFLQGIICSKDYMNPISYASSRFVKFCHIFTLHNLLVGSLYTLLGGILAWLHLSVQDGKFSSLVKRCEKLPGYCLVEEHYFLLLDGFWIGLYFFTSTSFLGSRNLQFSIIPQSKLSQVKRGIQIMITNTLLDAVWPTIYFLGFYSVFGNYCRSFFTSPFSLSIEDIPLDKISRLLSLSLIFYAWLHAVLFVLIIQSMHLLFQAYLTEWIPFDIDKIELTEKSKISLVDALTMEKIPILQQLGYLDLVTIAQKDKTRRLTLFTLSQPGGHPYNWNNVIEKSLSLIKKFSQGLNSACSNQNEQVSTLGKTTPISCVQTTNKPYSYHMRNLVSPVAAAASPIHAKDDNKQTTTDNFFIQYYKNMKKNLINYLLSKRLISYIFAEQFENKLRHVINDAQAVIWAADAISTLATVSLNEDPYGIVQKDLPEIIEVLLCLKQSLDKLQKLNISIRKPMSDDKFLKQTLTALRSAIRRSLYRIVSHFKNYIDDLALSPMTVDHLQPFFTYRE
jgi:nucleoporin NDC1